MTKCPACNDGWICEAHPNQPYPHCAGAGMPCREPECPDSMLVPVEHAQYTEGCMRCKVVYPQERVEVRE